MEAGVESQEAGGSASGWTAKFGSISSVHNLLTFANKLKFSCFTSEKSASTDPQAVTA